MSESITIAVVSEAFFDDLKKWKTANENHTRPEFKSSSVTDEEYEKLKECFLTMRETDDYTEYKKCFDKVCRYCHIVPRGVIIVSYTLKKGKDGKNSLQLKYSYNTKQITLDDDTVLYHMSKVAGIKELQPVFRGKSARGFLYDKHRIYFTIRKNMPKAFADYKPNEKMHIYVCKEKIRKVFVDPLVWNATMGAVYVETTKPIPVEELTKSNSSLFSLPKKTEVITNEGMFSNIELI